MSLDSNLYGHEDYSSMYKLKKLWPICNIPFRQSVLYGSNVSIIDFSFLNESISLRDLYECYCGVIATRQHLSWLAVFTELFSRLWNFGSSYNLQPFPDFNSAIFSHIWLLHFDPSPRCWLGYHTSVKHLRHPVLYEQSSNSMVLILFYYHRHKRLTLYSFLEALSLEEPSHLTTRRSGLYVRFHRGCRLLFYISHRWLSPSYRPNNCYNTPSIV